MTRPRKEVDWETVNKLCGIHCTGEEIASFLDMSYDTLQRRCLEEHECGFADYYKKASASGKMSLRRKQYEVAMAGNVSMLIWLGKNTLNQRDQVDTEVKELPPIQIIRADATH